MERSALGLGATGPACPCRPALELSLPGPPLRVSLPLGRELVVALAALEGVLAGAAADHVVSGEAGDLVVAAQRRDHIGCGMPVSLSSAIVPTMVATLPLQVQEEVSMPWLSSPSPS